MSEITHPSRADAPPRTLTAADRCDAGTCGSAAKVRATGTAGELLFCGHHWRKHEPALRAWAYQVEDETD